MIEKAQPKNLLEPVANPHRSQMYVAGIMSLLLTIATVISGFILIANNIHLSVDTQKILEILAVPDLANLRPEPLEKTLFLFGVLSSPVLLYAFFYIFTVILRKINDNLVDKLFKFLASSLLILIGYFAYIDSSRDDFYFFRNSISYSLSSVVFAAAFIGICFLCIKNKPKYLLNAITYFSFISIIIVVTFCVYDINEISNKVMYTEHFNAVFHAVVQVYHGKGLLVDLPHQYGMYPHFIEPFFKVFGLSVLSFTAVMGLLMLVALCSIYKFLVEISSNGLIARLGFCSLVYYGYVFLRIICNLDRYFQYHPIRFFFPALAIYLTYKYFKTNSRVLYYLSFIIYSLAVFWNFDTGFVVLASWISVLMFNEMDGLNIRNMLGHIARGLAIFFAFAALFSLYMYLRYGNFPEYVTFFNYQRYFYSFGYMMLPMEIFGPWHLVIATYLIGLLYSIASLQKKGETRPIKVPMVFFLSILGTGIFSYFQGRSHDLNLANVCYPAIIILTIFCDSIYSEIKVSNSFQAKIAFAGILIFFLFSSASLVKNLPEMVSDTNRRLRLAMDHNVTPYMLKTKFVKKYAVKGEQVLILSSLSSIYYLESGTNCPIKIPGTTELFLQEEYQTIYKYIQSSNCRSLYLDLDFPGGNPHKKDLVDFIAQNFQVAASTPSGIYLLVKR